MNTSTRPLGLVEFVTVAQILEASEQYLRTRIRSFNGFTPGLFRLTLPCEREGPGARLRVLYEVSQLLICPIEYAYAILILLRASGTHCMLSYPETHASGVVDDWDEDDDDDSPHGRRRFRYLHDEYQYLYLLDQCGVRCKVQLATWTPTGRYVIPGSIHAAMVPELPLARSVNPTLKQVRQQVTAHIVSLVDMQPIPKEVVVA
jgi:hypothetical protein